MYDPRFHWAWIWGLVLHGIGARCWLGGRGRGLFGVGFHAPMPCTTHARPSLPVNQIPNPGPVEPGVIQLHDTAAPASLNLVWHTFGFFLISRRDARQNCFQNHLNG